MSDPDDGDRRDCLDCHGQLVYLNGDWLHAEPADDCPRDRATLGESSRQILRDRLTPVGGFRSARQRRRAEGRARHTGGHGANYK